MILGEVEQPARCGAEEGQEDPDTSPGKGYGQGRGDKR
jgi:hypothetical protein